MRRIRKTLNKILSLVLVFVMVLGVVPMTSFTSVAATTPMAYDGVPVTPTQITSSNYVQYGLTESNWSSYNGYYGIRTAAELYGFAQLINGGSNKNNAVLLQDIVLNTGTVTESGSSSDMTYSWTPIGTVDNPYLGTFDGNGCTVSGLYINGSDSDVGLFGRVSFLTNVPADGKAVIKNVILSNSYIKGNQNVGGISGSLNGHYVTISNCKVTDSVSIYATHESEPYVGGINGGFIQRLFGVDATCEVSNCIGFATVQAVNADDYVGAVIGFWRQKDNALVYVRCSNCYYLKGCAIDKNGESKDGTGGYGDINNWCTALTSMNESHTCVSVEHKKVEATCQYPGLSAYSECLICGAVTSGSKISSEIIDHTFKNATCVNPGICAICGAMGEKDAENHTSDDKVCRPIEGNLMIHNVVYACCGATIGTQNHSFSGGDCITAELCSLCEMEGNKYPNNHVSGEYIYSPNMADPATKHDKNHKCCNVSEETLDHEFENAVCKDCNYICKHPEFNEDGLCALCGKNSIPYIFYEWDGTKLIEKYEFLNPANVQKIQSTGSRVTLSNGWYIVEGQVNLTSFVTVSNNVNILLCDGATLVCSRGIIVAKGNALNIFAQSDNPDTMGRLDADAQNSSIAGIGAEYEHTCGTINIHGGIITASGGNNSAGIGGRGTNGDYPGDSGDITIYNGVITATGGDNGAGIGGGHSGNCGNVTIYGGTITATGGSGAAGIGAGYDCGGGNVTIHGGTITALGGSSSAGIGGGCFGRGVDLVVTGGNIKAVAGTHSSTAIGAGNGSSRHGTLTDGNRNPVSLKTITLDGVTEQIAVTTVEGMNYGVTDVTTLDTDKLYFYLPANTAATSITAGGTVYDCKGGNTYYPGHSYTAATCITAKTCVRCGLTEGEALGHNNVNGMCTVCGLDENGVYHIKTADQLMVFAEVVNTGNKTANAILEADIDLSNHTWTPIGVTAMGEGVTDGYTGTFDGQGHVISNITFATPTSAMAAGIFGTVQSGGTVKNLGVENLTFDNNNYDHRAAGIAGQLYTDSTISDCYVINSTVKASSRVVGGIVGMNKGTVKNCYTYNMTLAGFNNRFGGISGDYSGGKLENCYTDYSALASSQAGTATNCEAGVSAERFASGEIAYKLNGSTSEDDLVWGQLIGTDKYPVFGGEVVYYNENKTPSYYNFTHEHEWKYEAVDTNSDNVNDKITATCEAEDCTDTNGGTVMISAPADLTYTGSAINAVVTNDLTTGDTVTVVYAPADKLTLGEPVNVGEYTATITLGEGDNQAEISVTYEITKAIITDISAAINSVTAPVAGETPDKVAEHGANYTAEISWNTDTETYTFNTEYKATLTLTPDANHTFDEVSAEGWKVSADSESGVVTLTRTYKTAKAKITSITAPANKELDGIYADVNDLIKILDQTITITAEDGTTSLGITWTCSDYSATPNKINRFTWTAEAGDLDASGNALTGIITVTNGDAIGVVITGTDTGITYNGNKYNVSGMFDIDKNVGTATYSIVSGGTGAGTLDGDTLTITKAGTLIIQVDTAATGIYAAGTAQATLTVAKGTGRGTVTIEGWTYGNGEESPVPTSATNGTTNVTYKYEGTGDTVYAESETAPTAAGTYKVTAAFAETDLYNACTGDATFTIAKRPLTATITVKEKDYDGNATATVEEIVINNKVDNDDVTVANGTAAFENATAGENKAVKFTGWTLTGDDAANYTLFAQPVDAKATINKIALTITADNHTITYGDAPANNGVSYDGFVNGETEAVLGGTLGYAYSYVQFGDIGNEFTITPKGLTSDNYKITFVSGKLTVNQKELGIDWGTTTFTYDGNAKLPTATATGTVNGDVISLTIAGAQTNAGTEAYTATVTGIAGDKAGNYKLPADVTTTFTIKNASQDAPNVEASNETVDGANDGKISGVDSTMEWRAEGETSYTAIEDNATELTGLTAGTYYVRYAAKDNYDASADTVVVIGVGNKLTVTIPQVQTGYILTVDVDELRWNGSVTLTFALAEGYSKTDAFAVKVNGSAVELGTDGKYTISNVQSNVEITVEGVADITVPEAEISIGENKWNSLLNNITFGLFFKETQKVEIIAEDVNTGSGLNKIYYYLATEEVSDFTSVTWTEYTDAFNINPDNEYIIYAKATDHAGNAVTISSTGLVLDATKPAITGIENGGTYYGDTTITATDKYLDTVKVDGEKVELTDGKYTIKADNAEHVVIVTDKAENVTEYKITVYKIYTVTYVADGVTVAEIPVNHGHDVENVPSIPVKEGYDQTAPVWDKDGKNITADTEITAVYTINKYTVKYVADGVTVDTQTVEHGGNATAPEIPEKTGYTQTAPVWDKDGKNITADTEITAVYTINKYTVKYVADGVIVDTQTVEHGKDAVAPEVPVKEGYDQAAGQWSHNGKNITADTTINAVYTINGYTITVPETQTGYTLTVDKAYVEWGSDAVLTFALADGYSKVDGTFAVKVNGSAVELETDGTYTIAGIKSNIAITVEGVADITAPEATIKIGDNFWNTLLNNITFGKFFKETQKVEITAADVNTGSGLSKIYYYLATEEVTDFTSVTWTEYTGSFNIEPNTEVIIYAWAEDNAGNDKYISSTGLVLDSIAPVITGITNGTTYYGTTGYTVSDAYEVTVTDNGSAVTLVDDKATIEADGKAHTIIVTDEAGNSSEVTVTVKSVADIDDSITVNDSNVTAEDKDDIQSVIDSIDNILNDESSDLTDEEKEELEDLRDEAQNLIDKIEETEKAVEDAITDADGFKSDEVTSDDKEEIEDLIKEIEDLIASDNTTDEQKADLEDAKDALEDRVQEIEDAAQDLEDAKAPVKDITSDNVTADDSDELAKAKETLEELKEDSTYTEEEKAEIQAEIDRITELEEKIAEVAKEVSDLKETVDGYDKDTVTWKDKDVLEDLIEDAKALLETDNLTDEQKETVEDIKADVEELVKEIEDAASNITTEDVKEVEDITSDNVKLEDKENLEEALEDLKEALKDNAGNYTDEEKAAIEEDIARIEDALESIEKVEEVIDQITELPNADDVDTDDEDTVADVQEIVDAYDKLTDHEKSLIDEELIGKLEDVQDKLSDYKIIVGADGSYTKGNNDGLKFTANGAFSKFTGIKVDGNEVAEEHYTAKAGSTVITLKASYLETLTTGKHELTVVYTDGEASCSFEVQAKVVEDTDDSGDNNNAGTNDDSDKDVAAPNTGDASNVGMWSILLMLSAAGMITIGLKRRKRY